MRNILKIIAIGSLLALEKRRSRKGMDYVDGSLLCRGASQTQTEIAFACFNERINQRLLRENMIGERIKIIGSIRTRNDSLHITIYSLRRAQAVHDRVDFVAIGILREVVEQGKILNLVIEAKTFYQGQDFSHTLEIKTRKEQHFKQKLLIIKGKCVLAKGIVKQVSSREHVRTICWLTFLDVLRETNTRRLR